MSRLSKKAMADAMNQAQAVYVEDGDPVADSKYVEPGDRLDVNGTKSALRLRRDGSMVNKANRLPRQSKTTQP